MKRRKQQSVFTSARAFGIAGAVAAPLGGRVLPAQQSVAFAQQDQTVCAAMGATYGSVAQTQCRLQQQRRRGQEQLILQEQARISFETAQTAQEMRDRRTD